MLKEIKSIKQVVKNLHKEYIETDMKPYESILIEINRIELEEI